MLLSVRFCLSAFDVSPSGILRQIVVHRKLSGRKRFQIVAFFIELMFLGPVRVHISFVSACKNNRIGTDLIYKPGIGGRSVFTFINIYPRHRRHRNHTLRDQGNTVREYPVLYICPLSISSDHTSGNLPPGQARPYVRV